MKNKPQVAYLTYDGLTDQLGQSQIMPYLSGLSDQYDVTVISFEKKKIYHTGLASVNQWATQHNIVWIPKVYHKWPPVLSTIYDLCSLWLTLKKQHLTKNFALIHARSYLTAIVAMSLGRKWKIPFIFDMRGFWADERIEGNIWDTKSLLYKTIYKYFKRKEHQLLLSAAHIVTLTFAAKDIISDWGVKVPITVIPTCVDIHRFSRVNYTTEAVEKVKTDLGISKSQFVLLYVGSWGTWYLTKEMIEFFRLLKSVVQESVFLIVTKDSLAKEETRGVKDVIIVEASHHKVPQYIKLADLSILFIKSTFSKLGSSATKTGELMAMGIPFITNKGWGDASFIDEKYGIAIDSLETSFMAEHIKQWINQTKAMQPPPLEEDSHPLSLKVGIKRYHDVYEKILKL